MRGSDALGIVGFMLLVGAGWLFWPTEDAPPAPAAPAPVVYEPELAPGPRVDIGTESDEPAPPGTDPRARWSLRNDEALEALDAGRLELARALLEECVSAVPEQEVYARNLAEVLARSARRGFLLPDRREQAFQDLRRAVSLNPERSDLSDMLRRWEKIVALEREYWSDSSEHFHLSYDGSREELLHGSFRVLDELERSFLEFEEFFASLSWSSGTDKIQVVIYRRAEFSDLTGLHWASAIYDGVLRISLEDLSQEWHRLRVVLRHELTHYFVHRYGGEAVPAWLNEGLAKWLERDSPSQRQAAAERARGRLQGKRLFSIEELTRNFSRWQNDDDILRAYDQSQALVAHIQAWYGERILFELLQAHARGESCAAYFKTRTGVELDSLTSELREGL